MQRSGETSVGPPAAAAATSTSTMVTTAATFCFVLIQETALLQMQIY